MSRRLVIVGGDAAGMTAATNARRGPLGGDLEIVAFERGSWASFSACGEPYFVSGEIEDFESLLVRSPEQFARDGIEVRLQHEVTAIDPPAHRVTVRDLRAGTETSVDYDVLVYATGAEARRVSIAGRDLRGVYELHLLHDAIALRAAIEAKPHPRRGVVVGGGYVGLEAAEALHARGLETTIVAARGGLLGGSLDPEMSTHLAERVRALGVAVDVGQRVECLQGTDGRVTAVGCGGHALPADLVLLATGTVPRVELAQAAGLRIGESGGVWVDDHQRTSTPDIYAAGDCAEAVHRVTGRPVNLHLGTIANRQGRVAGVNIGGGNEAFPGVLGTAITRIHDLEVSRTGVTEAEARAVGMDVVAVTFDASTKAQYWPSATPMRVRALADRTTRRIVGAQIIGGPTAGKRIDAIATAIWNGMTVDAMVHVDLSYAPPFSGVWDPVLLAARLLLTALGGPR